VNSQPAYRTISTAPEAMFNLALKWRRLRAETLRPPPRLKVSEWADRERHLSPEASAEPGRWYTSRAEYLRGVMDAVCEPSVHTVVMMSSSQVGKTECLLNVIGFYIDQDPAPMLLMQPTLEMAEAFSKDRLAPMLRDTPCLQSKVADARARDSGNTLLHKTFAGGHWTGVGANSPASLAMRPVRITLCDEVDRYPVSAGAEGDPVNLARKRSTTFWNRKLILTSTPTVKGASRIEAAYEQSDQRHFLVPCPDCGASQRLTWSNVRWDEGHPETALYFCGHCGSGWPDSKRHAAVRLGRWEASAPFRGVAGFHLNELYSSWIKLSDTATNFLEAKRLPELLRVWVNTALGETWEDQGEKLDDAGLMARREAFPQRDGQPVVPAAASVLTAGVDVQDNRIELEVVAWGAGEECWSLEYHVLHGDPSTQTLWQDLDAVLMRPRPHELGTDTFIRGVCVDTGGHHTQAAYKFCRERYRRATPDGGRQYVFGVKGISGRRPVWPSSTSRRTGGLVLYGIGVDTAKETVTDRLRIEDPGPGFCHFPKERGPEYFDQLTAEQLVTKFYRGFPKREWVKRKPRNEAFDCRVYVYSALQGLQAVSRLSIELELDHLRALVGVKREETEAVPAPDPGPVQAPKPPKRERTNEWLGPRRNWLRR